MFINIFDRKDRKSGDYIKEVSINLLVVDLLISSALVLLGVVLLAVFEGAAKHNFYFLIFPGFYALSLFFCINKHYEKSYLLYHINSYFMVACLTIIYGIDFNFHLYYLSIGLSIYLYALETKKYHNYLLLFYMCSFILVNVIPFNSFTTTGNNLKEFAGLYNLIMASLIITVKAIKYVQLKENIVEEFKLAHLKSIETEKLLKDKEAIFNCLLESSVAGVELIIFDKQTKEELSYVANQKLLDILKLDDYEMFRQENRLFFSPETQSNGKKSKDYNEELAKLMRNKRQFRYEWDFLDSSQKIVNTEVTEVRLYEDKIINLALIKDISNQKKVEKELFESEQIYRTLFENVYDGIKIDVFDKKNNKKLDSKVNKRMLDLFKTKNSNIETDDYLKFIPETQSNGQSSFQFIQQARKRFEKNSFINFRMDLINGEKKSFVADLTAVEIETENILKRIVIAKDVTGLVKKEKIIQEQLISLEEKHNELKKYVESNKQLELFAYKASHDLKNPIITIGKFAQILKTINSEKLNNQSKEYLNFIEASTNNLGLLIDDFLEFSKISNQKFNIKSINPKAIIQFVLNNLKPQIEACNATIKIGKLPKIIDADEIKFFTLLQNLLTNAIRYRKPQVPPLIEISSEISDEYFQFSISDNGKGIKDENKSKIFEIYKTFNENEINNSTLIQQKSTGIGLSICHKVIELHKGKLWVESVYGKGATFSFTISKNLNQIVNN